jgi:NifU-like protein involved in Fe-S cluster formation
MPYNYKVIDHYENPRNVGSMNADDKDVGTGMVGAPACGDVMRLQTQNLKLMGAALQSHPVLYLQNG